MKGLIGMYTVHCHSNLCKWIFVQIFWWSGVV